MGVQSATTAARTSAMHDLTPEVLDDAALAEGMALAAKAAAGDFDLYMAWTRWLDGHGNSLIHALAETRAERDALRAQLEELRPQRRWQARGVLEGLVGHMAADDARDQERDRIVAWVRNADEVVRRFDAGTRTELAHMLAANRHRVTE